MLSVGRCVGIDCRESKVGRDDVGRAGGKRCRLLKFCLGLRGQIYVWFFNPDYVLMGPGIGSERDEDDGDEPDGSSVCSIESEEGGG